MKQSYTDIIYHDVSLDTLRLRTYYITTLMTHDSDYNEINSDICDHNIQ